MSARGLSGIAAMVGAALRDPRRLLRWAIGAVNEVRSNGLRAFRQRMRASSLDYQRWIAAFDTLEQSDIAAIKEHIDRFDYLPVISVIMPVYDVEERWLRAAIESVLSQIYTRWELCIADDASPSDHVRRVLEEYAARDSRVRVEFRSENGHISAASNTALATASGEFIALLDHDDELAPHALYAVVAELQKHRDADLLYSDEDARGLGGERFKPMFKPDFSPELLLSVNCVSHLGVFRTTLVRDLGGFRVGYEGSQDYDLALRVVDSSDPAHIRHIPHVLYHWRAIPGSVLTGGSAKEYAHDAARRAIGEHLERAGERANVSQGFRRLHRVRIEIPSPPLVTVIVLGAHDATAERTAREISATTNYAPLQTVVADDLESGLVQAEGEVIVTVSAGLAARDGNWLSEIVSHALRDGVGGVGGRIVDERDRIVHAGLVLQSEEGAVEIYRGSDRDEPGQLYRAQVLGNYSATSLALFAARSSVLREVGVAGIDTRDPVAGGIVLCGRLRALGMRIVWTPYAELVDTSIATTRSHRTVSMNAATTNDPMFNANLSLENSGSAFAFPPRLAMPWRRTEHE